MITASLEVSVPKEMGADSYHPRVIWNTLAQGGILSPIRSRVPCVDTPVGWGELTNGVFFVAAMRKTQDGFTCRITLYPRGNEVTPRQGPPLVRWLEDNLFQGKATGNEGDSFSLYFFYAEGVQFALRTLQA